MEAKMDAHLREMKAETRANSEKFRALKSTLVSRMDAHHAKTGANNEELMAATKASREIIEALMDVSLQMTASCLEKIETNQGKVETEIYLDEMEVETIETVEDRYGDRHLAVRSRQQPKKWTRGDGVSRKKLAATRGRLTRHGATNMVVRDQARTMLYAEIQKDGRSRRDVGRDLNATMT
jgi:hypothetical protein